MPEVITPGELKHYLRTKYRGDLLSHRAAMRALSPHGKPVTSAAFRAYFIERERLDEASYYTLEIEGRAISIAKGSEEQTTPMLRDQPFLGGLCDDNGRPLWDGQAELRIRPASRAEIEHWQDWFIETASQDQPGHGPVLGLLGGTFKPEFAKGHTRRTPRHRPHV
jgi:hypothetical protein